MIIIKTRMRAIPDSCHQCSYYMRKTDTWYGEPACGAIGDRRGAGKIIYVKPYKERPRWCPLRDGKGV